MYAVHKITSYIYVTTSLNWEYFHVLKLTETLILGLINMFPPWIVQLEYEKTKVNGRYIDIIGNVSQVLSLCCAQEDGMYKDPI